MTTNALTTFTFAHDDAKTPVRVVEIDGQPWFIAADVCRVLGLTNATMALRILDDDEKGTLNRIEVGMAPGAPLNIISESGRNKLAMRSDKPVAKVFQNWIAREVLPAIRKDGMYVMGEEKVRTGEMSEDELVLKAMTLLQAKVERLRQENEKLHHERDHLSVDAFRAFITKDYWSHGFKVRLGYGARVA